MSGRGVVASAVTAIAVAALVAAQQSGEWPAGAEHATSSPSPSSSLSSSTSASAKAQLAQLPVKGRAPKSGYTREAFGPAWSDAGTKGVITQARNGCDTRNDVLRRDLREVTLKAGTNGCVVLTGVLSDPYTGRAITFERGPRSGAIQIDHIVSLSNAWQTGAQRLSAQQRLDLANDPLNLEAVDGPTNASKGDGDAATWLPRVSFRCDYIARQIAVKARHDLWVTAPEKQAMSRVLTTCTSKAAQ